MPLYFQRLFFSCGSVFKSKRTKRKVWLIDSIYCLMIPVGYCICSITISIIYLVNLPYSTCFQTVSSTLSSLLQHSEKKPHSFRAISFKSIYTQTDPSINITYHRISTTLRLQKATRWSPQRIIVARTSTRVLLLPFLTKCLVTLSQRQNFENMNSWGLWVWFWH